MTEVYDNKEICGGIVKDMLLMSGKYFREPKLFLILDDDGGGIEWPLPEGWQAHLITGWEANGWPK